MKTILIPLDSSAFSREALSKARDFFDPKTHTITLLQVSDLPPNYSTPLSAVMLDTWLMEGAELVDNAAKDYATLSLNKFRTAILRELEEDMQSLEDAGFHVTLAVEFGNPVSQIIRFAKQQHANLVIMATHARKGLNRSLLGSVSEGVVRGLNIPVLLVQPEAVAV